jgi:hypothetical protein
MSTTNPYNPYVAGGSGWAGQTIDLLALAQQQALARDEMAFKRWAAEQGFAVDQRNQDWLREQFYQSQGLQREELAFRRWAAEQGFAVDQRNQDWLREQFYQTQATQGAQFSEDLAFRRWAAEQGFAIDERNQAWAKEQFYQSQEFQREELEFRKWAAEQGFAIDGQNRDWLKEQFYQTQEFQREELAFKKWAAEQGFAVDQRNQDWLREQFYQTQEFQRQQATGYVSGRPFGGGANQAGGDSAEWMKTLEREVAEWNRELQQQGLGLNYLNTLSSLRGPRDWVQYANTVRAAEGSQLPAWAQSLVQGQNISQFQGAGDGGYQSIWNAPAQSAQAALGARAAGVYGGPAAYRPGMPPGQQPQPSPNQVTMMPMPAQGSGVYGGPAAFRTGLMPGQQYQPAPNQALPMPMPTPGSDVYGGPAAFRTGLVPGQQYQAPVQPQAPNWVQQLAQNPQAIRSSQWNNLLSFEREMLGGALENEGQDFNTWQEQMQRTWVPRQQVTPITSWQ